MPDNIKHNGCLPWAEIKLRREEVRSTYPSIHKMPVIYSTKKNLIKKLLSEFSGKLIDIGAGDRFVNDICSASANNISYASFDEDKSRYHDYYSLDDIEDRFNVALLLDIIEHLPLNDGFSMLQKCSKLLQDNGRIIITVPNNLHPTAFNIDCTHVTSYRYHDLGGLLLSAGFKDIHICRISAKVKLKYRLIALVFRPFMKLLDIDFATGILITARKAPG